MRENTDQKNSEYGQFSRSVFKMNFINLNVNSLLPKIEKIHNENAIEVYDILKKDRSRKGGGGCLFH